MRKVKALKLSLDVPAVPPHPNPRWRRSPGKQRQTGVFSGVNTNTDKRSPQEALDCHDVRYHRVLVRSNEPLSHKKQQDFYITKDNTTHPVREGSMLESHDALLDSGGAREPRLIIFI